MRHAIASVATGGYVPALDRLKKRVAEMEPDCEFFQWRDELPTGSPTHDQKQYGFKAYALAWAAIASPGLILWCDSVVLPIRPLAPLWSHIEKYGAWIPLNGWTNYDWTCDAAYADLFPGLPIEEAREINKTVPHCCATCFGINTRSDIGRNIIEEYFRLATTNAFCGPWSNTNNPNHWPQDSSRMGPCGPPDVYGHRHDQTALSVIAWRLGLALTPCPYLFSYPPGTEETIIVANGEGLA